MAKRIFDCFIFFNELDLLELRFAEHYDYVDFFVICESSSTFKGLPKPLLFADNRSRYAPFLNKVRHVVVDDMPSSGDAWGREFHQRSAIKRALRDLAPEDVVIVSDCDEFLSPRAFINFREHEGYFSLDMPMFQFYINMMAMSSGWRKVFAYTFAYQDQIPDYSKIRAQPDRAFDEFLGPKWRIGDGGWHFTFLGGAAAVVEKIRAYSHAEAWQQSMLHAGGAEQQMRLLRDVGGGRFLNYRDVDETFPRTIWQNQRKLIERDLIKAAPRRIEELESLVAKYFRLEREQASEIRYLESEVHRFTKERPELANIALGKPALQSSVSPWSHGRTVEADARGGNDGKLTGLYGIHTNYEVDPWWQVDLGSTFELRGVRIFNRPDQAQRLLHFSILISVDGNSWSLLHKKSDDRVFGIQSFDPYIVSFEPGRYIARYLRVKLDGKGFLHFDECLVFGRKITLDENAQEDSRLVPFVLSEGKAVTRREAALRSVEQIAREMCVRDRIPEGQWHLYMGEALQVLGQGNSPIYESPEAPKLSPTPNVE